VVGGEVGGADGGVAPQPDVSSSEPSKPLRALSSKGAAETLAARRAKAERRVSLTMTLKG
jgi:hypothetical protein